MLQMPDLTLFRFPLYYFLSSPETLEWFGILIKFSEYLQIHRVIGKKVVKDSTQYFVKWKDLPYADCTWEDEDEDAYIIPDFQVYLNIQ